MRALGRAGIGGVLEQAQGLAIGPAIEQDHAQPGLGIGIAGGQRTQRGFGRRAVAAAVGGDRRLERRRDIGGRRLGLGLRDLQAEDDQEGGEGSPHFALNVKAAAAALAFSISSGFRSRPSWSKDCGATGAFQYSAMTSHL